MKSCDECGDKHYAKGKCKLHYKMPSQLNPKPIKKGDYFRENKVSYESNGTPYHKEFRVLDIKPSDGLTNKVKVNTKHKKDSLPELLKLAEIVFNKWIRNRDTDEHGRFICISCGKRKDATEMDAGHYYPKTCSFLRFNENNVHGECQSCNRFHNDHLDAYAQNLIKKIGVVEVARLQCSFRNEKKWDREELLEIIKKYK